MSEHDAIRTQLEVRLTRLLRRAGTIEEDLKQPHDRDWQERATEVENDEVLEGLDEMTRGEIRDIRSALERIAAGSYGLCSTCGRRIGAERLVAIPSAATCVACAGDSAHVA
jgi:RNA polymerase-binding transcription factor DksA